MKVGYAQVSTQDQNLALQIDALEQAGCERIFQDTVSGTKKARPGLDEALDFMRPGDSLSYWAGSLRVRTEEPLVFPSGGDEG